MDLSCNFAEKLDVINTGIKTGPLSTLKQKKVQYQCYFPSLFFIPFKNQLTSFTVPSSLCCIRCSNIKTSDEFRGLLVRSNNEHIVFYCLLHWAFILQGRKKDNKNISEVYTNVYIA